MSFNLVQHYNRQYLYFYLLVALAVTTSCSASVQPHEDATTPGSDAMAADTSNTEVGGEIFCQPPWSRDSQGQCVCGVSCSFNQYCCVELSGEELRYSCAEPVNGGPPLSHFNMWCGLPMGVVDSRPCQPPWFLNQEGQCVCGANHICAEWQFCCHEPVGNDIVVECLAPIDGRLPMRSPGTVCGLR